MFLIVGLGNPGKTYEHTRHNLGFHVVDLLAKRHHILSKKTAHHAFVGGGTIAATQVLLAKPQTFMNESGRSVQALLAWHKIPIDHLIVVCDDLDLPPGTLRLRTKGSSAGHKGLASIIEALSSPNFPRLRIGVGKVDKSQTVEHILGKITLSEKKIFVEAVERAADALEHLLTHGSASAMNHFN